MALIQEDCPISCLVLVCTTLCITALNYSSTSSKNLAQRTKIWFSLGLSFFFSFEPHNLLYFVHNTIHWELNLEKYPKGSNNIIHINPSKIPTSFSFQDSRGLRQKTNYLSVNPNSPPFTLWTNEIKNFVIPSTLM
jgi:hypothetical protein